MAGSGTTTNSGTLTMPNITNSFLTNRTFNNNGTLLYQNCCSVLKISGPFNNNGLFDFQADNVLDGNPLSPSLFHNNAGGTLQKSAGISNSSDVRTPFNNDGTVAANSGTLSFESDGTHNGSFTAVTGSTISFEASQTFNPLSSLTGAGQFSFFPDTAPVNAATINSGTVNVGELDLFGTTSVTLNTAATVGTFREDSGTLNGTGALTITGSALWWGGTITGSGALTVNSTATFGIYGRNLPMTLDGRQLVNHGSITYAATAHGLTMANGAVITNAAGSGMDLTTPTSIAISGSGTAISNAGMMQCHIVGTIGIGVPVMNTGTIKANAGEMAFNGGLTQTAGSTILLGGSISSPSSIALAGGSLIGTGTVSAGVNNTNGIVSPGNAVATGTLVITGPYVQGVNGTMNVRMGGTTKYDILDASASGVTLAGTMNASLFNSFVPADGNTFDVLRFSTRTGDFGTYNLPTVGGGSIQNAYVAGTPNMLRLTAVVTASDLQITQSAPASVQHGQNGSWTLAITNGPTPVTNVVVTDTFANATFVSASPLGSCTASGSTVTCNLGSLAANQSVNVTLLLNAPNTVSSTTSDPSAANNSATTTTAFGTGNCGVQPPTLTAPADTAITTSPVTFSWTAVAGATSYKVFASIGGASTQEIDSTSTTSITLPVAGGSVSWFVQALGIANCGNLISATRTFTSCSSGFAPQLSVVGTSSSGQSYTVQWTDAGGAAAYELQESATGTFDNPATFQVGGNSRAFTKSAAAPTAFFYRVRALSACGQGPGPFSASQRVVVVPVTAIDAQSPSATVDVNNKHVVVQSVVIPGQGTALAFTASTDEPWLTVTPSSGIVPAAGLTLSVSADPADLPNGTFTATIIVAFPGAPAKAGSLGTKPPVTMPVSISVVTPVSPATTSTPSANSLIIPSVGHLDGINSQWRSDVRITNTAAQKISYLLRFTPAGDAASVKQTQVSIASNDTMALDDIVKNWYGVGALGDAANGVLEVRPLSTSGKGTPNAEDVNVSFSTVASSRTFNQSAGGTLGQYIPAIPFASFIGTASGEPRAGILSLQQIAQSPAYRTNLGIVEAAGKPVSVLVSVFNDAGKNLLDLPIDLKAGEQQQLNSFLAARNITLADGRIEVKVTGGEGKVTAYASVVDNKTADPLLVSGVPLQQTPARTFVLPGVADITNDLATWRSDVRIFNAGADPQFITMTLYPLNDATAATISRSLTVNPGEVTILDDIVASRFGITNIGGAMHVDTLTDANLVVTGRTYNQVDGGGTYGQFIAAVTPADAVGKGTRTLNVLQVEDSTRYRTNLGIAEVSGQPVTVEVSVFLPDAKVVPKVTIPLAANEYRQFRVLQQLGVGTAYNARIAIKVIDGDGRITAYGSVIDMQTQDPTYVPAQ